MTHTSTEQPEALPCPFCGGHSTLDSNGQDFRVFCWDCGAKSKEFDCWQKAEAAWNRRAPAVPVPQLDLSDAGLTAIYKQANNEVGKARPLTTDSIFRAMRAVAVIAAAPQPPEADMGIPISAAAPVQLPEIDIDTANHAGIRVRGYTQETVRQLLADQQFKLDELAMLTRMVVHAFRKVAPDNKTAAKAVDYLKRKGLQGNPLRSLGIQEQRT